MTKKIKLVKEKKVVATSPVLIDIEVLDRLKEIKQETNIPISRIAEIFIRMGLKNYQVVEPEDSNEDN